MPSFDVVATTASKAALIINSNVEGIGKELAATTIAEHAADQHHETAGSHGSSLEEDSVGSDTHFLEETKHIVKTEHKIAEENGEHLVEPLLKDNPHRFVIFPIQDDEVRNC